MNELLKKYKIEEVSKKTSISPLFLKKLRDGDFDKINRVKFKGFIKILKSEYPHIDFSSLQDEYNNYYNVDIDLNDSNSSDDNELLDEVNDKKSYKNYIVIFSLSLLAVILIYFFITNNSKHKNSNESEFPLNVNTTMNIEKNNSYIISDNNFSKINSAINSDEVNKSDLNKTIEVNTIEVNNTNNNKNNDINKSKEKIQQKVEIVHKDKFNDYNVTIIPLKQLWLKVYFLDKNKSEEHLSSNPIYIRNIKGRLFIKLGHGKVKIMSGNSILEPNSTKITRVIISKNEINITNKRVDYYR